MIVEGVNRVKRHTKVVNQGGRAGNTGGIITQEAAIHVSNVMLLVDAPKGSDAKGRSPRASASAATRSPSAAPTARRTRRTRSVRVSRKSGEEI